MREIFLVSGDSTESSLVFTTSADEGAEEFFLAVTDDLRSIVAGRDPENTAVPTIAGTPETPSAPLLSAVAAGDYIDPTPDHQSGEPGSDDTSAAPAATPAQPAPARAPREERELDPRISAPLAMSPREIQARIRSGATTRELAEENGVTEARIERYAHPVLLERANIAELAKQSHPVRENGPAKLTLWEILATAFATRGHDLTTATWDAYRDASNQWVVRVDWKAGLSDNHAEWSLNLHSTSSPTADPRTPVAADLIDPEFIQPVRSLTSVGGSRYAEDEDGESSDDHLEGEAESETRARSGNSDDGVSRRSQDDTDADSGGDLVAEEAEKNPVAEESPRNRRRKAVTPHWEDVLLGVRANTKRPKK